VGHLRLYRLPDTPRWRRVVGLVAEGASVPEVANATIDAADEGLDRARTDEGLFHAVRLLAQVAYAARGEDFSQDLAALGVSVPAAPGVFDVVAGFSDALDHQLRETRSRTDLGEMAHLAASEALAKLAERKAGGLWGEATVGAQEAFRALSTKAGFSALAHAFFSRLIFRYLSYHLSRELSAHVGQNQRFRTPSEHNGFLDGLQLHSEQAALITKESAGAWFSKAAFERRVDDETIDRFTGFALKKLRAELRVRGQRDDA
jgi:hypothetical protein